MASHKVSGPVSAVVAVAHAERLLLVANLAGELQAFPAAQDQAIIRQALVQPGTLTPLQPPHFPPLWPFPVNPLQARSH